MLVKRSYLIIFFPTRCIEMIFWFCVGYFFGRVFYLLFKSKKNERKGIADFFEKYKQRMTEKPSEEIVENFENLLKIDEAEKASSLESADPRKEFLLNLEEKVSAKFQDCIIQLDVNERILRFSLETHIIRSKVLAKQLIDTVDNHLKKEFFSSNGLAQLVWCEKYMLHSDLSQPPDKPKTQVVQFVWFRNLYCFKLCPCFICDSFKSKYDC